MEYQPKLNEKYTASLHCTLSFEGNSYKKDTATLHQFFYFLLLHKLVSTSTDIIFHNFLELHSTLLGKKLLLQILLF